MRTGPRFRRRMQDYWPATIALVAGLGLLAAFGCSPARSSHRAAQGAGRPLAVSATARTEGTAAPRAPTTPAPTTAPTVPPSTTTTAPPAPVEQPGWTTAALSGGRITTDTRSVTTATGDTVTLIRFRAGTYRLDLHLGGSDPPSAGYNVPAVAGNAVSQTERPQLLGAFNGGFKTNTGSGGFEVDGQAITPLVAGDASLVIDANGSVRVGVWGQDMPVAGEQVLSVRQNLRPLIHHGQPSPLVGDVAAWGATLGGVSNIARSAVGLDAGGDLVYAAGMHLLPVDLAEAMASAGVINAMELDINPYWVQADLAAYPGGPLAAAVPGQQRPAGQYLSGWTRDFFAVLAAP